MICLPPNHLPFNAATAFSADLTSSNLRNTSPMESPSTLMCSTAPNFSHSILISDSRSLTQSGSVSLYKRNVRWSQCCYRIRIHVYYLLCRIEHVVQHDIARGGSRDKGLGSKESFSINTNRHLTRERSLTVQWVQQHEQENRDLRWGLWQPTWPSIQLLTWSSKQRPQFLYHRMSQ